jgi:hypothetical protein
VGLALASLFAESVSQLGGYPISDCISESIDVYADGFNGATHGHLKYSQDLSIQATTIDARTLSELIAQFFGHTERVRDRLGCHLEEDKSLLDTWQRVFLTLRVY